MAFLDNSGDIILDAVLTDLGRRRLADNNGIAITKFALGDDEIDYALFDKNHPSGSAYYDLEILQTPVFEATTQINANVNYGLLSFSNTQLLYLPEFVQNELDLSTNFASTHQKIYYIAVNSETADAMKATGGPFATSTKKVIVANSLAERVIAYELGLNTSEISKNSTTTAQYIDQTNIRDTSFTVSVNNQFITNVWSLGGGAATMVPVYSNNLTTNDLTSFPTPANMNPVTSVVTSKNRAGYTDFINARGTPVSIYQPNGGATSASKFSVISGPSSTLVMLNFSVAAGLDHNKDGVRDRKFTQFGKTAQTTQQAFGSSVSDDGKTYDYIDTSVYLSADTTGATISIPVRLIRRAS